jgi:hypothetical protein
MRDLIFIVLAVAIPGPLLFFLLPYLGYPLKLWALVVVCVVAALIAGAIVLTGESLIEDIVKLVLFLAITGILWYTAPRSGFVFIGAMTACGIGVVLNQVNRAISGREEKRGQTPKGTA